MNKFLGDVRDVFFENIKKKFIKNKKYYILTNDADVFALKSLRYLGLYLSNQFINYILNLFLS